MQNATQFRDAEKYAEYLKTPFGRLRTDLAWKNLCEFLPRSQEEKRVLDVGGGTGNIGVRLAQQNFQVTLLDSSEEMLNTARRESALAGVAERISFVQADADHLHELFEPHSFDFVVCHNVLEFVAAPGAALRGISCVLHKDGLASVLLRNRAGEVLKAAIKSPDWSLPQQNLSAETVIDSLYGKPLRVFDAADRKQMFDQGALQVIAEYGVRVCSDYRDCTGEDDATYQNLLELELLLGRQPQFAAVARYTQTIARPCSTEDSGNAT